MNLVVRNMTSFVVVVVVVVVVFFLTLRVVNAFNAMYSNQI